MYRGKRNNCQLNSKRAIKAWMTWEKSLRNPQITTKKLLTKNYRTKYHAPWYTNTSRLCLAHSLLCRALHFSLVKWKSVMIISDQIFLCGAQPTSKTHISISLLQCMLISLLGCIQPAAAGCHKDISHSFTDH